MKKMILALALLASGGLKAADQYLVVPSQNLLMGDGFTRPGASVAATPWLASWLGGTALATSPAAGVTWTASLTMPIETSKGDLASVIVTVSYDAVTNSANISATVKTEMSTLIDSGTNTKAANTATAFAAYVVPSAASAQLYDIELGTFTAYPLQKVDLFFNRSAGTSGYLYVHRVMIKYKNNKWF